MLLLKKSISLRVPLSKSLSKITQVTITPHNFSCLPYFYHPLQKITNYAFSCPGRTKFFDIQIIKKRRHAQAHCPEFSRVYIFLLFEKKTPQWNARVWKSDMIVWLLINTEVLRLIRRFSACPPFCLKKILWSLHTPWRHIGETEVCLHLFLTLGLNGGE